MIRREVQVGKRAVKAAYGARGDSQFLDWLAEFYIGHREYVARQMLPVLMAMDTTIYADAAAEIGADDDITPEMEDFVRSYAASVATRMTSSSGGQLRKIVAETPPDKLPVALEQRLDEWEEKRPGKVAARESVQAGSATAKAVWVANGVRRLIWRTVGQNCPICDELDGKTVEITQDFVATGDRIDPGGVAPLEATRNFGHPPLHEGCDCTISPA